MHYSSFGFYLKEKHGGERIVQKFQAVQELYRGKYNH